MELNTNGNHPAVSLVAFTKSQLELAEDFYKMREIATQDKPNIEVVLIAAGNLKDIKKAYPNYFLDTQEFIKNLKSICQKLGWCSAEHFARLGLIPRTTAIHTLKLSLPCFYFYLRV